MLEILKKTKPKNSELPKLTFTFQNVLCRGEGCALNQNIHIVHEKGFIKSSAQYSKTSEALNTQNTVWLWTYFLEMEAYRLLRFCWHGIFKKKKKKHKNCYTRSFYWNQLLQILLLIVLVGINRYRPCLRSEFGNVELTNTTTATTIA